MTAVPTKPVKTIFEHFSDTVLAYYNLWTYLDERVKHKLASRSVHHLKTCFEFYNAQSEGKIKHGDRVILEDFFITEWIPRSPGGLASMVENNVVTQDDYAYFPRSYQPTRFVLKAGDLIPPFGSVRLPLKNPKQIILGAVSADEYHSDMGVLLSVNKNVYSEFLSKQSGNNAVACTLEGYVDTFIPAEFISDKKDKNLQDEYMLKGSCYVIRISSPIQTKFYTHDSHPRLNAWLMRRIQYEKPPIKAISGTLKWRDGSFAGTTKPKIHYGDMIQYDFCYWTIIENQIKEMEMARRLMSQEFIRLGNRDAMTPDDLPSLYKWLIREELEDKSRYGISSIQHLTEFGGRFNNNQVLITLNEDPRMGNLSSNKYISEIKKIEAQLKTKAKRSKK